MPGRIATTSEHHCLFLYNSVRQSQLCKGSDFFLKLTQKIKKIEFFLKKCRKNLLHSEKSVNFVYRN